MNNVHDQNDYGGGRVRRTTELTNEGDDGLKREDITRARQQELQQIGVREKWK